MPSDRNPLTKARALELVTMLENFHRLVAEHRLTELRELGSIIGRVHGDIAICESLGGRQVPGKRSPVGASEPAREPPGMVAKDGETYLVVNEDIRKGAHQLRYRGQKLTAAAVERIRAAPDGLLKITDEDAPRPQYAAPVPPAPPPADAPATAPQRPLLVPSESTEDITGEPADQ